MLPDPRPVRRAATVAVALLAAVGLSGCIQLPPSAPVTPTSAAPTSAAPTSSAATEPSASEEPSAEAESFGPFTVDDGAGDTWTYTVTGYELPTQIASGTVPDGMEAISLLIDATHDDGSASFSTCFEVQVVTDAGTYSTLDADSLAVTAVDDVYGQDGDFTGGRAIVVVPAGTTSGTFVVTSRFGDDTREFPFSE